MKQERKDPTCISILKSRGASISGQLLQQHEHAANCSGHVQVVPIMGAALLVYCSRYANDFVCLLCACKCALCACGKAACWCDAEMKKGKLVLCAKEAFPLADVRECPLVAEDERAQELIVLDASRGELVLCDF